MDKHTALCCAIIRKNGQVTVQDIVDCGFSEGIAVEAIFRMASRNVPAHVLVKNAKRLLRESGYHVAETEEGCAGD